MSEYQLAMIAYFALQTLSLALLPGWWRCAAAPSLLLIPMIIKERFRPEYLGDVFIVLFAIIACAYLVLAWIVFGVARLIRRNAEP